MDMDDYQYAAVQFGVYPDPGHNLEYVTLGLLGEAGEIANKVKKIQRDGITGINLAILKVDLQKELGDVLWYVAAMADELHTLLSEVAEMNLAKLEDRKARGVIGGSGDNR